MVVITVAVVTSCGVCQRALLSQVCLLHHRGKRFAFIVPAKAQKSTQR